MLAVVLAAPALAQDEVMAEDTTAEAGVPSDVGADSTMRIGGAFYLGMATAIGDFDDGTDGAKPRFAGGGAVLFDYFLSPMFALAAGVGIVGEGFKMTQDTGAGEIDSKMKVLYLQIPVGVKLDLSGFQVGAALAFDI